MSAMATFFEIMSYVEKGMTKYNVQEPGNSLPQSLKNILDYISKNFVTIKTVNQIADHFGLSLSTLERYFKKNLAMTPKRYLEDKKLQNARDLLLQNQSVTYACYESGFDDYSHFITIFKKRFQTTPFQYKKNI